MVFRCSFSGELWKYSGESSWWFIRLPVEDSEDLEQFCSHLKRSFGSIRVTASIGETSLQTSVFRDNRSNSYLLPVKANVRSKEKLFETNSYELLFPLSSITLLKMMPNSDMQCEINPIQAR
jgi:hypothetical protein